MPAPSDSVCSSPIALSYSCIAAVPGTLLSGLFVCPAELQYNQADVGLFVRPRSNTIRQMSVCMSGRAPIQSGRRGFESLAGSVLEEAQYNQAYELMNELHTIKQDRYITCSQKRGVHTCTSYVAKKVLCYKMIHVSLLR